MFLSSAIKIRIEQLCKEKNITINKLCTICGITQSMLANITSRPNTNLTILTIMRICRGLNINISDFFNSSLFNIDTLDDD
ncbi:dNA-binding helix-turn-helix protein [Clostridium sp. CAG:575]|nr:dNA-binding helix-turn-helix protein [Clostridium sp. CAG:575]